MNNLNTVIEKLRNSDAGATTAEYAVCTVGAAGLAGLLIKLLTSDEMRELLWGIFQTAFSFLF
ncbi:MAG: DUF4244 domain-containing protein [Candidatus Nanopelagicales bacterium]